MPAVSDFPVDRLEAFGCEFPVSATGSYVPSELPENLDLPLDSKARFHYPVASPMTLASQFGFLAILVHAVDLLKILD